jgi:hypothetical protein
MEDVRRRHPEIPPRIYRWSNGLFYLYLTNKSNVSGDLRSSFKWLIKAIREDPAVLTIPWVARCLLSRSLRMFAYSLTRSPRVWVQLKNHFSAAQPSATFEQIIAEAEARRVPQSLFDRIQLQRWVATTNHRSCSC